MENASKIVDLIENHGLAIVAVVALSAALAWIIKQALKRFDERDAQAREDRVRCLEAIQREREKNDELQERTTQRVEAIADKFSKLTQDQYTRLADITDKYADIVAKNTDVLETVSTHIAENNATHQQMLAIVQALVDTINKN